MSYERLRPTFTFDAERLEQLKAIAPEAFADGAINWDKLRAALGDYLDDGADAEHFGLSWPGKQVARRHANEPSRGTLVPVIGQGINEEITHNVFIEADNLDALKLLQKSYAGRVKLIYIDPPYNTGEDFIYVDDYSEPLDSYLKRTNQTDEYGNLLTTNPKGGGRFHSNWMNMIYPRLLLARTILCESGSIWISIDDGEYPNLRLICDELFGEENFVATFIWEKRTTRENRRVFSFNHDYIVCYARDKNLFQASRNLLPLSEEALGRYSNPDNDPRGDWQSVSIAAQAGHATPSQFYTITTPSGRRLDPPPGNCWRVTEQRLQELIADNRIWFGIDGSNVPRRKLFLSEANDGLTPHTLWKADEVGTTDSAKKGLNDLFNGESLFDTPKSVDLLKRIVHISTSKQDIVMDFFAGSSTTAHAVLELNCRDGAERKFIMVQIPDRIEHNTYQNIAELSRERIRRVISKLATEKEDQLPLEGGITSMDLGFRVYQLASSNYKNWQDYDGEELAQVQTLFDRFETPLIDEWQPARLLTEVMLLQGFPLDSLIGVLPSFTANTVQRVTSDFHAHSLFACFDETIAEETINALTLGSEDIFVCLDSALTDESKARLSDTCNLRTI